MSAEGEEEGKGREEAKEETLKHADKFNLSGTKKKAQEVAAEFAEEKEEAEETESTEATEKTTTPSKTESTDTTSSTDTTESTDTTATTTETESTSTTSKTKDTDTTEATDVTEEVDEVLDLKISAQEVNGYSLPGELVTDKAIRNVSNLNMYVGEEWRETVSELYEDLNYEHRKVHGEELEKNREFYPALLTVMFQNLDEFRDALDLDPSGHNPNYEP